MKISIKLIVGLFALFLVIGCAPVTKNDRYTVEMNDGTSSFSAVSLYILENDIDIDGTLDISSIHIVENVLHGELTLDDTTGQVLYIPNVFYRGRDRFTYTVQNTAGEVSNIASVIIQVVGPENKEPIAEDDIVYTTSSYSKIFDILKNDKDTDGKIVETSIQVLSQPSNGTLNLDNNTGELTYVSDQDYVGDDTFSYRVKDNNGEYSNKANVFIHVLPARKSFVKLEPKAQNWYVSLTAEMIGSNLKTESSKLGVLDTSNAQKHTLQALKPFGNNYLDIVFINPPNVSSGEYKTDFHTYVEGVEESWMFTIKTDNTDADILLSWKALYVLSLYTDSENRQRYNEYKSNTNPLIKYMKLIDTENGEEVAAVVNGEFQNYIFNMNGQTTHTFKWVVSVDEVNISTNKKKISIFKMKKMKKNFKSNISNEMFDLSKPPMIQENKNAR